MSLTVCRPSPWNQPIADPSPCAAAANWSRWLSTPSSKVSCSTWSGSPSMTTTIARAAPVRWRTYPSSSDSRRSVSRSRTTTKAQGWRLLALPLQRATVSRSSSTACGTGWSVNRRTVRSVRKNSIASAVPIAIAPILRAMCRVLRDSLTFPRCGGSVPPRRGAFRTASETAAVGQMPTRWPAGGLACEAMAHRRFARRRLWVMPLNAGLVIPRGSASDLVARVEQAERRGIATAWTTVGGPTADPVTAYAAAAAATDRIGLGTAVTPTYPRHPITLAAQAIAINDLASGRLRLGVGPSHKPVIEGSYGLRMGKPLAHLREYVTILRMLLWEGAADFSGDYFTVKTALPAGVPAPRIPVPISALRPNAFRLAGEIADGAISWVTPIDYLTQTALPELQAGAEAMGRERPSLIAHVPVC